MKAGAIVRLHRLLCIGIDRRSGEELANSNLESDERRIGGRSWRLLRMTHGGGVAIGPDGAGPRLARCSVAGRVGP